MNAYDGIRKRNNTGIEIELVLFPKIICWSFGDNHPNLPAKAMKAIKVPPSDPPKDITT